MKRQPSHPKGHPAISVRQPFAYAIMHLGKDVENKSSRTRALLKKRVLIHASLTVESDEALKCKLDPDELTIGAIVGSVEIADCIRNSKSKWASRGSWHWVLKNPRVLSKPIRFKGKVGIFYIPDRLLKGVRFQKPRRLRDYYPH
jgi:hypothetical protein